MSWVITRYVSKSGGNNIKYRIGQFNKFSYSGFVRTKQLSKTLVQSPNYKRFQRKIKNSRQSNILYNTYGSIDEYTRAKRLYTLHSKKFFTYISGRNKSEARNFTFDPTISSRLLFTPKYTIPIYILWSNIYAREIIDMIKGTCRTEKKVAKKNNWNWDDPSFTYNDMYVGAILTIIIRNKKYSSMDKVLKETMGSSLVKCVLQMSGMYK